jgi:hypothetical protein
MAAIKPTLSLSKLAEAIAGATRRGWSNPTMVFETLVTARRLRCGEGGGRGSHEKKAFWNMQIIKSDA